MQLPDKLSCTIDLATATGKSYVLYGIARIMPAEGAIDQVLVLCPSNTIETGLTEKFRSLSADKTLKDLLPDMANPPARDEAIKEWKQFLLDPKYNFKYVVGDSGTCYVGNDYFADVIYRFSLRESIEEKFIKTIDYVAEDVSHSKEEKFQKIYDNHIQNKSIKYRLIKPLTILVTKNISACKKLTEKNRGHIPFFLDMKIK